MFFSTCRLGDSIASKNAIKFEQSSSEFPDVPLAPPGGMPTLTPAYQDKENLPFSSLNKPRGGHNTKTKNMEGAIDNIIQKMQTGLEVRLH